VALERERHLSEADSVVQVIEKELRQRTRKVENICLEGVALDKRLREAGSVILVSLLDAQKRVEVEEEQERGKREFKLKGLRLKVLLTRSSLGILPLRLTKDAWKGFFPQKNARTRVLRDREGRSKRFGFVEFGDANSLIVALEKNRKELLGRAIRLDIEKHALKTEERPNRLLCLPREVLSYMLENFAAARSIARLRGTCTAFKKHIDENPKLTKKVQTARTKAEADQLKRSAAAKRRPHTVWDDDHRVDYLAEMQDAIQAYKYGSDW